MELDSWVVRLADKASLKLCGRLHLNNVGLYSLTRPCQ